ncbi:hypothetical protein Lsan_0329 [Legionella santicrucis]|uniref:Uncharacterized protein n=1 Tax=Legionella santicrucis TaxID=45074 RepID=A0A0W0ZFS2_9GAMM|nr:hypothetical protein [Legionella santicrucis]KTD67670.1 hypothetical protein Lsan_0329 [Legionella santicrucis]
MNSHFVEEHFQKIVSDLQYRQELINNPKQKLSEEYGCTINGNIEIEIVEQKDNTITIMLPTKPASPTCISLELKQVTTQVVDLLFSDGIGGYLIPNDNLKWVLRDMRKSWMDKLGFDLAK